MARLELFDSHAHMDCSDFDEDRDAVFQEIGETLEGMINPGCDNETSKMAVDFAHKYPFVYAAVGWHPEEIGRLKEGDLDYIYSLAQDPKVVAIGEIGLDYYNDEDAPHDKQREIFIKQIHMAKELNLPIIVHDREAHGDCLDILKKEGKGVRGVFHCYSGSWEMAKELIKLDFYLGFGGSSTFKNASKLREVLRQLPEDRILFETDSPYLTPVPFRGKRNKPTYTEMVLNNAAEIRGEKVSILAKNSTINVKNLFNKIS